MPTQYIAPAFLSELLHARSPSGHEYEAQAVFDRHVKPAADTYENDALGEVCRAAWIAESGEDPFNVKEMVVSGAGAVGIDLE